MDHSIVLRSGLPVGIRGLALLTGLLCSGVVMFAAVDTHYVSLGGNNTSPYTNGWANAATQIQWAVDQATAGDTVLVSNGTYNLTNQIVITNNITLKSLNGTNVTFINGNYPAYSNRCVFMGKAWSDVGTLDGFTISNGYVVGSGAGVCIGGGDGSRALIYDCYIHHNVASNGGGGGIYFAGNWNQGVVSNCTIVSNASSGTTGATAGGGVFVGAPANVKILNCYIAGNTAKIAGGMACGGGSIAQGPGLLVDNCTLVNNQVTGNTGAGAQIKSYPNRIQRSVISGNSGACALALYDGASAFDVTISGNNSYGVLLAAGTTNFLNCQVLANAGVGISVAAVGAGNTLTISDCVIAGNKGRGLDDIGNATGAKLIKNCLIYGNTNADGNAGGVYINGTSNYPCGMINCTIAGNQSSTKGGGVYAVGANNYIDNCIVYFNVTTNDGNHEIYNDTPANAFNYYHTCTPFGLPADRWNITADPLFIDRTNTNFRLGDGSPCVNAGANQAWMTNAVDLDGKPRVRNGVVDLGVYESLCRGTIFTFR